MAMTNLIAAIIVVGHLAQPARQLTSTIVISPIYRTAVATMLRYSPTFRRQYNRLVRASDLRIEIVPAVLTASPDGALTRIVRRTGGMDADVQVGPFGDPVLLIAHEFEHILEQLDDVDLPAMATRTATGVHLVPGSTQFETDRAIAAGRQVADEVRRGRARDGT
jgi:hypothetical protein